MDFSWSGGPECVGCVEQGLLHDVAHMGNMWLPSGHHVVPLIFKKRLLAVQEVFAGEGIPNYTMDGLTGNTYNSHRLIAYAAEQGGIASVMVHL
jgi:hypothetical protein